MKVLAELVGYQVRKSDLVRLADLMGCLIFCLGCQRGSNLKQLGTTLHQS